MTAWKKMLECIWKLSLTQRPGRAWVGDGVCEKPGTKISSSKKEGRMNSTDALLLSW